MRQSTLDITSTMKFRSILPSKKAAISAIYFVTITGLACFNIFVHNLHKEAIAPMNANDVESQANALRAEFLGQGVLWQTQQLLRTANDATASSGAIRKVEKVTIDDSTIQDTAGTDKSHSTCIPSGKNSEYNFQPTTKYKESTTMPKWMIEYFDWHREQTSKLNECNYKDFKFLILRCSDEEKKCGGVADRLKSIPFFIAASAISKRIFLIRWSRPTKLENFLLPNEISWAVPDWLPEKVGNFIDSPDANYIGGAKYLARGVKRYSNRLVLEGNLQDFYGGSRYYHKFDCELDDAKTFDEVEAKQKNDYMGWPDYMVIFRDMFFTMFEPAPPIKKIIEDKMESANLVPNEYVASHYRAFWCTEDKKQTVSRLKLMRKTTNALNCASQLQPGAPVYFASDSQISVLAARKMNETHRAREIVTFNEKKEALHLDKKDQWKSGDISDFYPTFVDLLVMSKAKCIAFGVGGFGAFANLLSSNSSCYMRHDHQRRFKTPICEWTDGEEEITDE